MYVLLNETMASSSRRVFLIESVASYRRSVLLIEISSKFYFCFTHFLILFRWFVHQFITSIIEGTCWKTRKGGATPGEGRVKLLVWTVYIFLLTNNILFFLKIKGYLFCRGCFTFVNLLKLRRKFYLRFF